MLSKNKNLTHGVSADTPQLGKVVTVQIVTMLIAVISMLIDGVMTGVFLGDDSLAFQVEGLENVQKGRQYIFCPNHQTHFDGLFTWAALGDKCPDIDGFGCMSKAEHLDHWITALMASAHSRSRSARRYRPSGEAPRKSPPR